MVEVQPRRRRPFLHAVLLAVGVFTAVGTAVFAEEPPDVDATLKAAASQAHGEAIATLEDLLAQLEEADRGPDVLRVRRALAERHVLGGTPFASLEHYEALRETQPDNDAWRLGHATALIATARANLERGGATAAAVVPYLEDARTLLNSLRQPPTAAEPTRWAWWMHLRAQAHYYAGNLAGARRLLDAVKTDTLPRSHAHPILALRADVAYRQGDHVAAAEAYTALGHARGAAAAWAAAKDAERTVASYRALLDAAPSDAALAADALRAARYVGGEAALADALAPGAAAEDTPVVRLRLLAILQDRAGQDAAAAATLERWAQAAPQDAEPRWRQGRRALLADAGPAGRAAADTLWMDALGRDPTHAPTIASLWHLAGLDQADLWKQAAGGPERERTLRIQRALVAADPGDATAWANLGNTLRTVGEHADALKAYARAREENPYDPGIVSDRGLALAAAGLPEEALAAWEASLAVDPGHLAGRQNAARAHWQAGRLPQAQDHLAKGLATARAIGRDPMTWRFLLDRVWRTRHDDARR